MTWSDEYLPLLFQVYFRKPEGVKPLYSRQLIDLSLELHTPPRQLYAVLTSIRRRERPTVSHMLDVYAANRHRLSRDARRVRQMSGFGQAEAFYKDVDLDEPFEAFFRPIDEETPFTPLALTLVLELYFRLSPATMIAETPEVADAARRIGVRPNDIVSVMQTYMTFDPYLAHRGKAHPQLAEACRDIWNRHSADDPEALAATAAQMWEYYRR